MRRLLVVVIVAALVAGTGAVAAAGVPMNPAEKICESGGGYIQPGGDVTSWVCVFGPVPVGPFVEQLRAIEILFPVCEHAYGLQPYEDWGSEGDFLQVHCKPIP